MINMVPVLMITNILSHFFSFLTHKFRNPFKKDHLSDTNSHQILLYDATKSYMSEDARCVS
jgi:hypothetical protein